MAAGLPEGSFLGIDQSERQVAEGCATIEAAGLKNVGLKRVNLLDAEPDLGTFDYIICHGVFSWVPREVQDKLLAIIAETLAPDGVALVSYNVYPGWYHRQILRDAMLFHLGGESDPQQGIRKAREVLHFLSQFFLSAPENFCAPIVRDLSAGMQEDAYLLHEYLAEVNQPLYYHQFLERAGTAGLKAVSDARFSHNASLAPEPVKAALRQVSDDPVRRRVTSISSAAGPSDAPCCATNGSI